MLSLSPGVRYILLSTIFFALMNIGVKYLPRIPAYEIVFFRALVTLIVVYVMLRQQDIDPRGNHRSLLIFRGLAGTAALLMYFYTLHRMPLASAVTIQYLSPIFTVLIAGLMLRESARPIQYIFFAISFGGVLMLKGFDSRVAPIDLLIGILAAVLSGLAYNFIRKLRGKDHPLVVVFYFPLVTVPLVGVYTFLNWVSPSPKEWLILVMVGLATTIAQIFMTKGYQLERAANITNFNYLGAIYAIAIGYFLFGEALSPLGLAGITVIIAGILLSTRFANPQA